MARRKLGALAHSTRMRIVLAFVGDRELTTNDLAREMPDLAPASLYRQIAILAESGLLQGVKERRVRGTVERCYRMSSGFELSPEMTLADRKTVAKTTADDQAGAFAAVAAGLIAAYDGYLARGGRNLLTDPVGLRTRAVYADDKDRVAITEMFNQAIESMSTPGEGKRRVLISTVLTPA